MAIQLPMFKRKDGEEQPYIPAGPFKIRIPGVHWGIEMTEVVQAMVMFVTGLGAIAVMQDVFGMSFAVALTIVCIHELAYCSHQMLGDPIIPGWITPSIPLMLAYLLKYGMGVERIQALIACQVILGLLFLILGTTGLAKKLLDFVPKAMQAGIILGAGIAAIIGKYCFAPTGNGIMKYPFSISIGGLLALYLLFSKGFTEKVRAEGPDSKSLFVKIANYGMVPGIVVGILVGWMVGEIPLPKFEGGIIFIPHFRELISGYSIFGVGIPSIHLWIAAIPMALVAYIIAFGDMIVGRTVIEEANRVRTDEYIDMDPNRLNLMCGIRNVFEGLVSPFVPLGGPLWAGMTVAVAERYKLGRKAMDSIFGGSGSFNWMKFISCMILPLVYIFKPALPVALSLTLLIQGFACVFISMKMVDSNAELGVAGITGGALAVAGPAMGLAVGLTLSFFLLGARSFNVKKFDEENQSSNIDTVPAQPEEDLVKINVE